MKYKPVLLLSIVTFILSSCIHVYFIESQPKGGIFLTEFPEELHGQWFIENSEVKLEKNGLCFLEIRKDSLSNTIDTIHEEMKLSDTFQLYKAKQFYVLNYRDNKNYWEIVVIEKHRNGDIYFYETSLNNS